MHQSHTFTRRPFQHKRHPDGEIIVYPPESRRTLQTRSAIVITPYTIELVKSAIRKAGRIKMGASRDKPPDGSLGAVVKAEKQSPQQLSYLIPILVEDGFCRTTHQGSACVVIYRGESSS